MNQNVENDAENHFVKILRVATEIDQKREELADKLQPPPPPPPHTRTLHVLLARYTFNITSRGKGGGGERGVHLMPVFPPLNLGLMRISRSRHKQSKNSLLISQIYVKRCFVNFWGCVGRDSFFQRISKIWSNKKHRRINVLLKLEFGVKN